ncbi:hypothetical protein P910_001359 [Xylella fastidiosa Mul-MD]|nr:hypothetical protein P910_001359 [Xylella fastidiosa Mul-MD]
MGLIARLRRWYHLWVWWLRYWWYDTPSGVCAQHWALGLGVLVFIVQLVRVWVAAALPAPHGVPAVGVATGDCGCGGLRVGGVAPQTGAGQTTAGAGVYRLRRSSGETSLWHRLGR